jgi:hypothetical protein
MQKPRPCNDETTTEETEGLHRAVHGVDATAHKPSSQGIPVDRNNPKVKIYNERYQLLVLTTCFLGTLVSHLSNS